MGRGVGAREGRLRVVALAVWRGHSVNITGRLTTHPEPRFLPSGEAVCKVRLAVEGLLPSRETGYLNVSCFGSSGGQAAARVLSKGSWP